ncbi:MAG: 50S ribosomal protein L32e [Candidatus Micrarchaeota archaeon]|nr:50S ribosomal protein L32e [Candidatus Micrarchaeota archaeon]MCX8154685.1 50S ribosomal protein L32e [Candidatus Micrarchaeota archaeon]
MKRKKIPEFHVIGPSDGHRMKRRIKDSWRKPRGIDNKKRVRAKQYGKSPNIGYRNPKDLRGMHPSGYFEILIERVEQLNDVDRNRFAVRLSGRLGRKKKLEIQRVAMERGFHVLNPVREVERK